MRRNRVFVFLRFLLAILLLWMPKSYLKAEETGYDLTNGKLTILTADGFVQWNDANSGQRQSVTKIEIAEGVRSIPVYAFQDMKRLQMVKIPASLDTIGGAAFFRCMRLSTVQFTPGSKLKMIGAHAFRKTDLRSVFIPDSVKEIRNSAFKEC